ncbi:hypothetical protein [Mesorhizobium sp. M0959]|uniref:hypothetical protein n=1 Tax=unclassified Mesorhizobium TaxID=325217 RepID=UPI00333BAEEE
MSLDQAWAIKNTAARTSSVHKTTDSFKARLPCAESISRVRLTKLLMVIDIVGAAIATGGALTPSFPQQRWLAQKPTSNVWKPDIFISTVLSNSMHAK